jgi:anti-sigma-K factor RskA
MNGHPTREEDFDLYALGALEGDEKQAIESHVAACSACAQKLAEAQGRIARLAFAAPLAEPSPRVRERLLEQIHGASGDRSVERMRGAAERPGAFIGRWWAALLVPAGVVLALAAILLWKEDMGLARQLAAERASIERLQKELDAERQISTLVEDKDTMTVSLAPMPGMPQGTARVFFNSQMGKMMCDGAIAPAPKNMTYQLWLVPKQGAPISAGFFDATAGEYSSWMAAVPKGVAPMAFAVTIEPAGGMPHPTGPKVLVGPVS